MINIIKNISIKWVISFIITLFLVSISFAEETKVTANVTVANNKPEIVSITPRFSPVVMGQNVVQSFSIQLKDIEWDNITYTITPDYGGTSPISGTITNATKLQNAQAFINFIYLSSNEVTELWSSKITLTLNDWVNPVTIKEIDLYIF